MEEFIMLRGLRIYKIDRKSSSITGSNGIASPWNASLENCLKRENH